MNNQSFVSMCKLTKDASRIFLCSRYRYKRAFCELFTVARVARRRLRNALINQSMSDWQSHKKPYMPLRNRRLATLATVNSSQEALLYRYREHRKILDASFVNLHMLTKPSPQSVLFTV